MNPLQNNPQAPEAPQSQRPLNGPQPPEVIAQQSVQAAQPAAPVAAPAPSPVQPAPATPSTPLAAPAPITPPAPTPIQPQAQPSLQDWPHERTLQPIDEAAVLRDRAIAEDAVVHATPAAPSEEQLPQQNLEVSAATASSTADAIERAPDNAPVPATEPTLQDLLPPVLDEHGKIDNRVEDEEVISWSKRIAAAIFVPIAWMLSTYGLSQLVNSFLRDHVIKTISNDPQVMGDSLTLALQTYNEWSWLVQSVPYIAIIPAALIAFFFLKYPHGGYRLLVALSVTAAMVGLVQLLPHIPALKEHIVAPSLVGAAIVQLFDAIKNFVSLQTIWVTIGVTIGIGLFAVLFVYGVIRLLRFRVPGIVTVLALVAVAVAPIAVAVPLDIQARQKMIEQTNALIDRVSQ